MPMLGKFEADEGISSIKVVLHTAAVAGGGTDSDVNISLFTVKSHDKSLWFELDTDNHNDFEAGHTDSYTIPSWYFSERLITDIRRLVIEKEDDFGSDWAFGWIQLFINGKPFYASANSNTDKVEKWLSDGERWEASAPDFVPIDYRPPEITSLGLPDVGPNSSYDATLNAVGGRKPLTWSITTPLGGGFSALPILVPQNPKGTSVKLVGHSADTQTSLSWMATFNVKDADNRSTKKTMTVNVIKTLPPPTIKSFNPNFGWPSLPPAAPQATVVTIESTAQDFDSRTASATRVFFRKNEGEIEGVVVPGQLTATKLQVTVPSGAITGILRVQTAFGSAMTAEPFFSHPAGYRFLEGFSFSNNKKNFPDDFAWERYDEAFGYDEMWIMLFDHPVLPNPVSSLYYVITRGFVSKGCCHGFSLSSLQMHKNILAPSFPVDNNSYPLTGSFWDFSGPSKPSALLSNLLQSRQLVVWSDEGLSYFLDQIDLIPNVGGELCQMDARPAVQAVKKSLQSNLKDPTFICFAKNCSPAKGHVVVPYNLEQGDSIIRVYDCDRPATPENTDDQKSFFEVKSSDGSWNYDFSSKHENWSGVYMFAVPLSQYGHQYDWSLPGINTFFSTIGTFMLGVAAGDENTRITQVADTDGKALFTNLGRFDNNRANWPAGVRAAPILGDGNIDIQMFGITRSDPVTFTVAPAARRQPTPPLFILLQGGNAVVSLEEFDAPHNVTWSGPDGQLKIAPIEGTSNAIIRICRRFPETVEALSWAFRVQTLDAGNPLIIGPTADRRGIAIGRSAIPLRFDVEVTHGNRIGQHRILQSDGIEIPQGFSGTLNVTDVEEFETPNAKPLRLVLTGAGDKDEPPRLFGSQVEGPMVVAPHRVVTPLKIAISGRGGTDSDPQTPVAIDVSKSISGSGHQLRIEAQRIPSQYADGKVIVQLQHGTRLVRLVARDETGRSSFPRDVYVTVPSRDNPLIPISSLSGSDVLATPGSTVLIPLVALASEGKANKFSVRLQTRERLSGLGTGTPSFTGVFTLDPGLQLLHPSVTCKPVSSGLIVQLNLEWDPLAARDGRIDLGTLSLFVPAGVALGSTFVIRGTGSLSISHDGVTDMPPLNVLPVLVKVWGGREPSDLHIVAKQPLAEGATIALSLQAPGLAHGPAGCGWWVEKSGGRATIRQGQADPLTAQLTGVRAGLIKVWAVVGTRTTSLILRVQPTVAAS